MGALANARASAPLYRFMLHIHNGDAAANIANQSSLPGEHIAWRESLITGPTPAGLSKSEWRSVRSSHLSEAYGIDKKVCEQDLLSQEKILASFLEHDGVVLWFDHDLFCQLHLIYLLDWFSQRALGKTKLSLICIGEFPGRENFRGLGELNPEEMASLFPVRQHVTAAQLELGAAAWQAYCSANPTDIERVLQTDTSALPFFDAALRAHLRRFPSTRNGLDQIANLTLQLIHDGLISFSSLFAKVGEMQPVYGLGDAQFWHALQWMGAGRQPLIEVSGTLDENLFKQTLTRNVVQTARFKLTPSGEAVLNVEADAVVINGVGLWLGGVHLSGTTKHMWRWDEQTETVVHI